MTAGDLSIGAKVRVLEGFGYLSGKVGLVTELPEEPDHNRPIPDWAFATVRFDGEIPPNHRCDPEILESAP